MELPGRNQENSHQKTVAAYLLPGKRKKEIGIPGVPHKAGGRISILVPNSYQNIENMGIFTLKTSIPLFKDRF